MSNAHASTIELSSNVQAQPTVRSKSTKGSISGATVASYFGIFLLVISMIAIGYHPPVKESVANVGTAVSETSTTTALEGAPVDQLMASNIAATIAESADMPITADVANLSQSLAIESTLAQTDTNVISKPQIVQPAADSRISQQYTTVAGDTVPSVAQKFGVSATTIKWANKLTSDTLEPGKALTVPPVDGVMYTVKSGDTIESIASKYKADPDRLIAFNDLELTGNPAAGTQIIIPGGDLPTEERPGYVAPTVVPRVSYTTINWSGGGDTWRAPQSWIGMGVVDNGYPFGQCTYYAAVRRAELGMPVGRQWGNGGYWRYSGAAAGRVVDNNPSAGAVMDGAGHVAVVESIEPGVRIFISEMNGFRGGGGWGRVGYVTISWGEATSGMYKYVH